MKLRSDWKKIVTKAWSFKIYVIAFLITALEMGLPYYTDRFTPGTLVPLLSLVMILGMLARTATQKEFEDAISNKDTTNK